MSGIVITIAGVWVLAQVFGGDALGRLGILGGSAPATTTTTPKGGGSTKIDPPAPGGGGPELF